MLSKKQKRRPGDSRRLFRSKNEGNYENNDKTLNQLISSFKHSGPAATLFAPLIFPARFFGSVSYSEHTHIPSRSKNHIRFSSHTPGHIHISCFSTGHNAPVSLFPKARHFFSSPVSALFDEVQRFFLLQISSVSLSPSLPSPYLSNPSLERSHLPKTPTHSTYLLPSLYLSQPFLSGFVSLILAK